MAMTGFGADLPLGGDWAKLGCRTETSVSAGLVLSQRQANFERLGAAQQQSATKVHPQRHHHKTARFCLQVFVHCRCFPAAHPSTSWQDAQHLGAVCAASRRQTRGGLERSACERPPRDRDCAARHNPSRIEAEACEQMLCDAPGDREAEGRPQEVLRIFDRWVKQRGHENVICSVVAEVSANTNRNT